MRKLTFDEIKAQRLDEPDAPRKPRVPLCAVLDSVRSLYNVGSVFRTADALWMAELVLTGFTPHPPRREIDKTALGATRTVPWRYIADPVQALQILRSEGYEIWGVELTTESAPLDSITSLPARVALVFGNEVTGIAPSVLAACDRAVDIPMHGTKHSLNVAVAFGIACHHLSNRLRTPSVATRTPS